MSDDRTTASDLDDFTSELLRSAQVLDRPSEAGRQRARALLALGAGAALAAGARRTASIAPKATSFALWKAILVGVVGAAAVAAVIKTASSPHPREESRSSEVASAMAPATALPTADPAPSAAVPPPPSAGVALSSEAPQEASSARATPSSPASSSHAPLAASSTSLSRQLAALDHARDLLAARRPGEALDALGEFDRQFPGSTLAQEAAIVRIEALVKAGRSGEATALARSFLDRYPTSSHAEPLRKLISGSADQGPRP